MSDETVALSRGVISRRWYAPGTYVLILELSRSGAWEIGRLGRRYFPAGHYAYVGSALGPGGLAARIGRHLRSRKRVHWHIDYLLAHADIRQIGVQPCGWSVECAWAEALLGLAGAAAVVPRFGASDCRCRAHLIYWESLPAWEKAIDVADVWALSA